MVDEMLSPTWTHELAFGEKEVRKRYVSWERGEADREWACLTTLATHAPGIAPRPLRREIEKGAPVIVMERLPGTPLGSAPLTRDQFASLGRVLRKLYSVPLEAVHAAKIGDRPLGPHVLPQEVARWLGDSADLTPCRDPRLVRTAVEASLDWLEQSHDLPTPRIEALGISDLNPANVLWDGRTCRLVDFEDGGLTDPAYELADAVEHIAGRISGTYAPDALLEAVELTPEERDRVRAYRPLWSMYWLVMLLPGNSGYRRNPSGTTEAQAEHVLSLVS